MSNYIEQKKTTYLYFQLGSNKYAVNTDNVLEIMKLPKLDYPQKLPNNIIGLLKYNNFVINVIDIRFFLNMDVTGYSSNSEILILKTDELIFGIITDKVIDILNMDSTMIDSIPFMDNKMIIESLYKIDNETISMINIYALESFLKQHDSQQEEFDVQSLFPQDATSAAIMEKRRQIMSEKASLAVVSKEMAVKNKYISFNLNNDFYCLTLDYVKEVLKDSVITKVPGTPGFIEGIMNLRGDYITVINLKKFLSLPEETGSEKNPLIIVECNELKLALLIDKINELFEYQAEIHNEASEGYYAHEFIYEQTLYSLLDIDKITSDKKIIITDM